MEVVVPSQVEVVSLEVFGRPGLHKTALRVEESDVESADELQRFIVHLDSDMELVR